MTVTLRFASLSFLPFSMKLVTYVPELFLEFTAGITHKQRHRMATSHGLTFLTNFGYASIAVVLAKTVMYPVDRSMLLRQLERGSGNLFSVMIRTARDEGLLALWAGNFESTIRYIPMQALNFALKDLLKSLIMPRLFNYNLHTPSLTAEQVGFYCFSHLAIGALAGAIAGIITFPIDVVRAAQAQNLRRRRNLTFVGAFKEIISGPKGFFGLYQGLTVALIGICSYRSVYFGVHDLLSELNPWRDATKSILLEVVTKVSIPLLSYVGGVLVSYPFDTILRRNMFRGAQDASWFGAFSTIVREDGFSRLYVGVVTAIFPRCITPTLVHLFYDLFRESFPTSSGAFSFSTPSVR